MEGGGRVDSVRGDTITIVAFFVTRAPAVAGAKTQRTVVREPSHIARLTIVVGAAVGVEPWTASSERPHQLLWNALMVITVAPLLLLVIDIAHNSR
jgi:hypothetical protein